MINFTKLHTHGDWMLKKHMSAYSIILEIKELKKIIDSITTVKLRAGGKGSKQTLKPII